MERPLPQSVVICALARDCEDSLRKNIPRIEELRGLFTRSSVIVIENDSKDLTKTLLSEWQKNSAGVNVLSEDLHVVTIPQASAANEYPGTSLHRIGKMASFRNKYMEWIEGNGETYDLVLMIDIDVPDFSIDGIYEAISKAPGDWGALFANGYTDTRILGKPVYTMYFDMYAYMDTWPASKPYVTYGKLFAEKKKMNERLKGRDYLPVLSAFGGIGVYKYEAIAGLRYKAVPNGDQYLEALCEHVPFNKEVADRGFQSYICSGMKVYYGKSENLIVVRNNVPLWLFKLLCLVTRFRKLKE
jgi:hypothetical protein